MTKELELNSFTRRQLKAGLKRVYYPDKLMRKLSKEELISEIDTMPLEGYKLIIQEIKESALIDLSDEIGKEHFHKELLIDQIIKLHNNSEKKSQAQKNKVKWKLIWLKETTLWEILLSYKEQEKES